VSGFGDGIVIGIGWVDGWFVVVVSYDFMVSGGFMGCINDEKFVRVC